MLVFFPLRTNGVEDQYSVIIRFDDQTSADGFYQHFNGRRFSSLEVCSGYVFWFRKSIPHILLVKLYLFFILNAERLDQDTGGILTTICNHTFHCSCISKWADSSCPVSDIFCVFELLNSF
ncbi:hypothetical protein BHE74_00010078 [Ensete ventricosum]|nr:hypothetical protein BHE74_00010078 [Ensete ventricosum]